jgi:uncharacterized protein
MIDKELLEILACPRDHTPLRLADAELLRRLNRLIALRQIKNQAGREVEDQVQDGLVTHDGAALYPIVDDIPVLLVEEAIPLDQLGDKPAKNGRR